MGYNDQKLLDAVLRRDFYSFIARCFAHVSPAQELMRNWSLEAIAWHLEQCRQGKIRRLIITMPPRHLKSISTSVAFPAFILGHDPTARMVCVSYSAELAAKHARDCRAVMGSTWYKRVFPDARLSREKNSEFDFMTTRRGYRLSTSVGGTLTGRGGNWIILDDPMKPDEAMSEARRRSACNWYDNTLSSRLDDKRSDAIILVMQRLHLEDLVGHLLAKDEEWVVLNLPATAEIDEKIQIGDEKWKYRKVGELLHPEREPQEILDSMRLSMGSFNYSAQYQQSPIPEDGELFKWPWFNLFDKEPAKEGNDEIVQSWDTASKSGALNDYSVCTTWLIKGDDYYLLDLFRARLIFPDLKRAVIDQAAKHRPDAVLIEDTASGMALIQEFKRDGIPGGPRPIPIEVERDKITRASAQSAIIEAGHVHLPRNASWLGDLRSELMQFPNGRHDDQIDSITQLLKWRRERVVWATKIKVKWY